MYKKLREKIMTWIVTLDVDNRRNSLIQNMAYDIVLIASGSIMLAASITVSIWEILKAAFSFIAAITAKKPSPATKKTVKVKGLKDGRQQP